MLTMGFCTQKQEGGLDLYKKLENSNVHPTVLHMMSGGRDSFLAAALLIEQGFKLKMVTFDNGHIDHVERAKLAAQWITEKYPESDSSYLPVIKTAMTFHEYMLQEWYRKSEERLKLYPELQMYQAHCLACKTAMYVHAIAYCKANGIAFLSEGARESQGFFVELPEMKERYERICQDNGIQLLLPVYDLESDLKRKRQLCDRGLSTKTLEPQCYLGCPLRSPLTENEKRDLAKYFDQELYTIIQSDIDDLIEAKRVPVLRENLAE